MMNKHDVEFYLTELSRLLDPRRVYERFGGFGEDALVDELQEYYGQLNEDEKRAFCAAVLRWLSSGDDLRRTQGIRLCGDLRLAGCLDELLHLGGDLRQRDPAHPQLGRIVEALGQVGDRRALDFLRLEVLHGEYRNGAVLSIAQIDESMALDLVPELVRERYEGGASPESTRALFWLLLGGCRQGIARRLGVALRCFHDKPFLVEQFSLALRELAHGPGGGRLPKRRKRELLDEFRDGLAAGRRHSQ